MIDRADIIKIARSWLGTPYKDQASVKGQGCDCLGLLRGVYREIYGLQVDPEHIPAYQSSWYDHSNKDELLDAAKRHLILTDILKPGCVVVFRMKPTVSAKHCAILVDTDTMIHSYSYKSVFEVSMGDWWKNKIVGIFDFPEVKG